jgi:Xaa-Pro aminopeptidase
MQSLFSSEKYVTRRNALKKQINSGIVLIFGNNGAAMNYQTNCYPFRQDSNFLYLFGLDSPGLCGIIDVDSGEETLVGNEFSVDDLIWDGCTEKLEDKAKKIGVKKTLPVGSLGDIIRKSLSNGRKIHYLPSYRGDREIQISILLDIPVAKVKDQASSELIKAVIALRSFKDADEIEQIEFALNNITSKFYQNAIKMTNPGTKEQEILAMIESVALEQNCRLAYPAICTINGQYLHNESYDNTLQDGQLLLIDAGSESPMHYASDITRTYPVGKSFTTQQAEIYQLVLDMMQTAFTIIKPGIPYSYVHQKVTETLAKGLVSIGLMKGNAEEIVNKGAHALFFPHGLGHLLGLDVHDMEDLGENNTGYDGTYKRSTLFGTQFLRYGKELKPGLVHTVEPGIYFIPALIDLWQKERKFENFINFSKLDDYKKFGGIRVEDNVLVTEKGYRILGTPIPKTINEIETLKNLVHA